MKETNIPAAQLFLFSQHNWPGWKLGTVITGFYSHHDGTNHFFEGVAIVDQIRRTADGRLEVIVRDYPDEKAAAKPPAKDTHLHSSGIRIISNLRGVEINSTRLARGHKHRLPRTSRSAGIFLWKNNGFNGDRR